MDANYVFTVKKTVSHEDFIRKVMHELALSDSTPIDVCNATFHEVRESVKEVLYYNAHVEADYTASIGYNREEQYWDQERKRASDGTHYYEKVLKTRTVTDWHPHSGHTSGDAYGLTYNEPTDIYSASVKPHMRLAGVLKEMPVWKGNGEHKEAIGKDLELGSVADGDGITIHDTARKTAEYVCELYVSANTSFPGDEHKDVHLNSTFEPTTVACYRVPYYEVLFTYNEKTYRASGFGCGDGGVVTEYPKDEVNLDDIVKAEMKPMKIAAIATPIALAVFAVILMAFGGGFGEALGTIMGMAVVIAPILILSLRNKKMVARREELRQNAAQARMENYEAAIAARDARK